MRFIFLLLVVVLILYLFGIKEPLDKILKIILGILGFIVFLYLGGILMMILMNFLMSEATHVLGV